MASSPVLPEPSTFEGEWSIARAGGDSCTVTLTAQTAPGFNVWKLSAPKDCLSKVGMAGAVAWRPDTDGLAFVAADEATVAFFSRTRGGHFSTPSGTTLKKQPR